MSTPAPHESLSHAVLERVAEAEDVDPVDIDAPLYEAIDPDALDSLFAPAGQAQQPDGQVAFTYYGYRVLVDSSGGVGLAELESTPVASAGVSED